MRRETVLVPGARRVEATFEEPDDGASASVVACPPHPRYGGHRGDARLRAVSEALLERGVACLRLDYGEWDDGLGEREDVRNACRWAADRHERVALFGYSFGAGVAALAAADVEVPVAALALLAPPATVGAGLDVVAALDGVDAGVPVLAVVGARDETVSWRRVADAVTARGGTVETVGADHGFAGERAAVAAVVVEFLGDALDA